MIVIIIIIMCISIVTIVISSSSSSSSSSSIAMSSIIRPSWEPARQAPTKTGGGREFHEPGLALFATKLLRVGEC